MAVSFDAVSTTNSGNSTTSLAWAHTCSGANRCLIVSIGTNGATATAITYAGVAMSQVGVISESTTGYRVSMWKLVAPASGTNNIVATFAAGQAVECKAVSYTGVDQTLPTGTFASATGNASSAPSITVTSAVNDVVVDAVCWNQSGFPANETVGAGQTERSAAAGAFTRLAMSEEVGAASVTMSWTMSATTNWAQGGFPLHPVSAAGIAFAGSTSVQNGTAGTTIVITKPGGTVDGDTLFAVLTWTSGTVTVSAAPAGWTLIGNTTDGTSNHVYLATYYKLASSEGASYTWTLSGAGIYNAGSIWRITGAHATTPFDAFAGQTGTGSNATAPTITTATNNELVAFVVGYNSSQAGVSFSTPIEAAFVTRDSLLASGISLEYTASVVQAGAGATGTVHTVLTNALAGDYWAAQLVSFQAPASAIDPRANGIISIPQDVSFFYRRNYPIGYFGFMMKDTPPPALLPCPPFTWTDLPLEYQSDPPATAYPQSTQTPPPIPENPNAGPPSSFATSGSLGPRISLPPQTLDNLEQWQRQSAAWMNEANQGHLQNTGIITLAANSNTTVVLDERAGISTFIGFMPRTVNAAAELGSGTLFVSSQGKQTFTITHANNAQSDRTFIYSLLG